MSHYDDVLYEARQRGEMIANKYISELYNILRDEEQLPPEDCREKIEHDCLDIWSKATIRKFLPEETKNPKKRAAGKIASQQKKTVKEGEPLQAIALTSDGGKAVGMNPAENNSFDQKEQESRAFHKEFDQALSTRTISPELLEAQKIISDKDEKIVELRKLLFEQQSDPSVVLDNTLFMSHRFAKQIYNFITELKKASDFIIEHDGHEVTAVQVSSSDQFNNGSQTRTKPKVDKNDNRNGHDSTEINHKRKF